MRRLPLFPLPVVLYPGSQMPLHIFEPRYRRMVATCIEADSRFGLLYHDAEQMGEYENDPGRVGCIARIEKMQPLPDGRSLILVEGEVRFELRDGIEADTPYHEGVAVERPDETRLDGVALRERRLRTLELFGAVVDLLEERPDQLPETDPGRETAYQLAPTIQTVPAWHQGLLEERDEVERLRQLDAIFQAAIDQRTAGGDSAFA